METTCNNERKTCEIQKKDPVILKITCKMSETTCNFENNL